VHAPPSSLEKLALAAPHPKVRTLRLVEAARAYLREESPDGAVRCLYAARAADADAHRNAQIDALFGLAYLQKGEASTAERYFLKYLRAVQGTERDVALAYLSVSASAQGRFDAAERYRQGITKPQSPQVESALATPVPPATARAQRWGASDAPQSQLRPQRPPSPSPWTAPDDAASARDRSRLVVQPRSAWRAGPLRLASLDSMGRVDKVTIHHSGGPTEFHGLSSWQVAAEIRKIQRYHQREKRWADIGYHYLIDPDGRVWQGRPVKYQGAHAGGAANYGNVGLVLLGDYSRRDITPAQGRSLSVLVARLCAYFGVPPERVYTHGEIRGGTTDCPGPQITRFVRRLRASLERQLVVGKVDRRLGRVDS
jgi:hypothetical protein